MGFDARVELLEVVYVATEDLDVLQAVLLACSAPESKDCCAALQPPHMHLHITQGIATYPVVRAQDIKDCCAISHPTCSCTPAKGHRNTKLSKKVENKASETGCCCNRPGLQFGDMCPTLVSWCSLS